MHACCFFLALWLTTTHIYMYIFVYDFRQLRVIRWTIYIYCFSFTVTIYIINCKLLENSLFANNLPFLKLWSYLGLQHCLHLTYVRKVGSCKPLCCQKVWCCKWFNTLSNKLSKSVMNIGNDLLLNYVLPSKEWSLLPVFYAKSLWFSMFSNKCPII